MTLDQYWPRTSSWAHRLMGRLTAGVVAVTWVVATYATAAGAATIGGPTPFGVVPSAAANGQSRSYFSLNVAPGQSAIDTVVITNAGTTSETLKVSSATGITAPNSASAFSDSFKACVGTGCWVSGLPSLVTLDAGASKSFTFTVAVPVGTPLKQYLAGITAEPSVPPPSVIVGQNGKASARAVIIGQVSVGVAVTVGALAQLTTNLQIPTVTGGAQGPIPRLLVHLANTGQTFTKANGTASCTVKSTQVSFPVSADTVLPGDGAVLPINAKQIGLGATVPCSVSLGYGSGLTATWSGTVTTPAVAPTKVVHTGKGAFSNLPVNTGIATWAIILIVVAALILLGNAAMGLRLLRRRARRRGSEAGAP